MTSDQIRAYLSFYEDLGVTEVYRRTATLSPLAPLRLEIPTSAPIEPMPDVIALPSLAPEGDTLAQIRVDISPDCRRCRLCEQRNKIVFGSGNEKSPLVFVGEGPGADEDAQGLPFVGRAGQLLTQMINGTASKEGIPIQRDDVYICNVVKCRPPENRRPEDDEVAICSPFLYRQLDVIQPKAIVCLGLTAAQALLKTKEPISRFRGQWLDYRGTKLLATYHPAYLLRNPPAKAEAWKDLQKVMAHLGLKVKKASK